MINLPWVNFEWKVDDGNTTFRLIQQLLFAGKLSD